MPLRRVHSIVALVCLALSANTYGARRPSRPALAAAGPVGSGPSLGFPTSIALDPSGAIHVADHRTPTSITSFPLPAVPPAILRIEADGTRTIVSDVRHGTGPGLDRFGRILLRESDGTLTDGLLRIDPVSGDRTALPPLSPSIADVFLRAQLLEPGGTMLLGGRDAVIRKDPDTGTWTLVSGCVGTQCVGGGPPFRVVTTSAAGADGTLYAADFDGLVRVDPLRGDRTRVSGLGRGTGPDLGVPTGLALEGEDHALWAHATAVLRIALDTGDRTTVSDESTGEGPLFRAVEDLVRAPGGGVLLADGALGAVLRLDPATGNRALVSGGPIGAGVAPTCVLGGTRVAATALVVADCDRGLVWIDLATGDRTLVSGAGRGAGPAFTAASDVAVMPSGELIVADVTSVKAVDPVTGDRRIVSDGAPGRFRDVRTVVAESESSVIVGDRGQVVTIPGRIPQELQFYAALQRIDLASGAPQLVSGGGRFSQKRGFGLPFNFPIWSIAVESPRTLAAFRGHDLLRVNVRNGNRRLVASAERGTGPWFASGSLDVAIDASGGWFVIQPGSMTLLRVDAGTGDRTVIASHERGSGPMFDVPRVVLAEAEGTLLVVSSGSAVGQPFMSVMRVDPVTGDRTVLSRP
jgi:hypothetical protein